MVAVRCPRLVLARATATGPRPAGAAAVGGFAGAEAFGVAVVVVVGVAAGLLGSAAAGLVVGFVVCRVPSVVAVVVWLPVFRLAAMRIAASAVTASPAGSRIGVRRRRRR